MVAAGAAAKPYLEQPFEEGPAISDDEWASNKGAYEAAIKALEDNLATAKAQPVDK